MAAHGTEQRVVADRYVLEHVLGHGGFGVVWRAHDSLLQRDVAIKEIHFPEMLDAEEQAALRERVLREARASARLTHPGVVTVFDVIEEEGRPLIVMELVEAPTLKEIVERDGPMDPRRAAALGAEILEALTAAHEHGIVHRDVKPANVMVHQSGRVQLADFGIASILDDPKITTSGKLAGSPSYMAPEQAENHPTGPATDLWGLGATLYYAVEGEPPFEKEGAIATLASVVSDEPRPMLRAGVLEHLLRDLLAKDPAARPSSGEVNRRLVDISSLPPDPSPTVELDATAVHEAIPMTIEAPPPPPARRAPPPPPSPPPASAPPPPAAPPRPAPSPAAEVPVRHPRSRPAPRSRRPSNNVPIAVLAVLVVAGLVALVAARAGRSPTTTTTTTVDESASVPADWVAYEDPETGFAISHPPTWTVSTNGTLTDVRDPVTRAYLRIDHVQPPGPSPEGAWYTFEPKFAAENNGYRRIQITPTTFKGFPAAIWEFTYTSGGVTLHAVDLGFIAGDYGFALNFQTHGRDWERMQPVFEQFKASFKAPGS